MQTLSLGVNRPLMSRDEDLQETDGISSVGRYRERERKNVACIVGSISEQIPGSVSVIIVLCMDL